jgi:selenocysteine lyase/cysteine desulfurase
MQRRGFVQQLAAGACGAAVPGLFRPDDLDAIRRAGARLTGTAQEAATDEEFWREIQQAFSVNRTITNLDNGNVCPSPRIVTEAMVRYTWEAEDSPAFMVHEVLERQAGGLYERLATLSGCSPDELALTRNATEALHNVLLGVPLKAGDEVLTTAHDYWGMLDALEQRRDRDGITLTMIPVPVPTTSLDQLLAAFERAITPRTRLILVSHAVNLTGQLFPVRQLCEAAHRRNVQVVVDGAQTFGLLDYKITDLGCDYFGTSLHKWLLAPIGTGLLYVRRDHIASTWPLMPGPAGGRGTMFKFWNLGTGSPAPFLAISEAIAFHNGIGAARKEARLRYLTRYWTDKARDIPGIRFLASFAPEMSCGIATFQLGDVNPDALRQYLLERYSIVVQSMSTRRDPAIKGLRVTPNVYTTLDELDRFVGILHDVGRNGIPKPPG